MKKIFIIFLGLVMIMALTSCAKKNQVVEGEVIYYKDNVVTLSFDGLGVEWGTYEDTDKLVDGAWEKITSALDRLKPSLVRCMTNFDWFVTNFDNKGTEDLNDDTWSYNFKNKYMNNTLAILDYCESHSIKVAFGVWNVIGSVGENDIYGMIPNATSDIRWAKMSADMMDFLIKKNGYTCIKWYVSSNEPNWTGNVGSSKNAYNTYEKWEQGVKNVRAAFDAIGLTDLDIIGGDTTSFGYDTPKYMEGIATNLKETLNNYGVHMYISNYDIDNAIYQEHMSQLYSGIKELDSSLGETKSLLIWETGLLDGKNATTDCNAYIANYSYGIRMADLTVQSILAGVNGLCYWDLDDAMHFMYLSSGMSAKEWGMFSTLSGASATRQELRPWFHSSCLLSNLLRPGSKVYSGTYEGLGSLRTIGVASSSVTGGYIIVNNQKEEVTAKFRLEDTIKYSDSDVIDLTADDDLYVYIFNEKNLRLDSNGYVTYNYTFKGKLYNKTELTIPASSIVIVTNYEL